MKKFYSKPDILFDSFSMSTGIANTCEVKISFAEGGCGVELTEGINVFTYGESSNVCGTKYEDGQYNGLCYHVPFDSHNVFNS